MKKVAGTLRLDLAQYREKQAFAQFGSDLDASTRQQLARGERLVELLKQPQYKPMPVELQVLSIFSANEGFLDFLEVKEVLAFESQMHEHVQANNSDILAAIRDKGGMNDDQTDQLRKVLDRFTKDFIAARGQGSAVAAKTAKAAAKGATSAAHA